MNRRICHCDLLGAPVVIEDRPCGICPGDTVEFTPENVKLAFDWFRTTLEELQQECHDLKDRIKKV